MRQGLTSHSKDSRVTAGAIRLPGMHTQSITNVLLSNKAMVSSDDFVIDNIKDVLIVFGHRENVLYTKSGKEKIAYFCPTCGRKLQ